MWSEANLIDAHVSSKQNRVGHCCTSYTALSADVRLTLVVENLQCCTHI